MESTKTKKSAACSTEFEPFEPFEHFELNFTKKIKLIIYYLTTAMKNRNEGINDILLKFVDTKVYDIYNKKSAKKYVHERDQFEHHINNKQNDQNLQFVKNNCAENKNNRCAGITEKYLNIDEDIDNSCNVIPSKNQEINKMRKNQANKTNRCTEIRERYLNIDSKDRDTTKWPNQNNYVIDVTSQVYTNVWKVDLVSTSFINTEQLIYDTPFTVKNNIISWDVFNEPAQTTYTTEIDAGKYTASELSVEIETKMNAVPRTDIADFPFNFEVIIDTQTDEVIFTSNLLLDLAFPGNPIRTVNTQSYLYIETATPHGLVGGDWVYIQNSSSINGIPADKINRNHTINTIVNPTEVILFQGAFPVAATSSGYGGGPACRIGLVLEFNLLFNLPFSPAAVLGFEEEETGFAQTHANSTEYFPLGEYLGIPGFRIKIAYMLPGPSSGTTIVVSDFIHNLTTGARVYIFDTMPLGTTIVPYTHEYGQTPDTAADTDIRDVFVSLITLTTGHIISVVNPYSFMIQVQYGDYTTTGAETISEYIEGNVVDSPAVNNGNVILKENEAGLDFIGNQYFLMNSNTLAQNFACSNFNVENKIYAKINISGEFSDQILDTYVGGKKVFLNNTIDTLNQIDFQFKYCDGTSVDFLDIDHSFVLKITEILQKVENANFSSKIGK